MIQYIKRRIAIRRYVTRLSQELLRRFGIQRFYGLEQVTSAVERSGFSMDFIPFAHAIYCSRREFEGSYKQVNVASSYDNLRAVVGRRYFGGSIEFDAANVVRAFRRQEEGHFYDSETGDGSHGND